MLFCAVLAGGVSLIGLFLTIFFYWVRLYFEEITKKGGVLQAGRLTLPKKHIVSVYAILYFADTLGKKASFSVKAACLVVDVTLVTGLNTVVVGRDLIRRTKFWLLKIHDPGSGAKESFISSRGCSSESTCASLLSASIFNFRP